MSLSIFTLLFVLLLLVGVPVGIFFAVRVLIRYNARVQQRGSHEQEELKRMKIDDL